MRQVTVAEPRHQKQAVDQSRGDSPGDDAHQQQPAPGNVDITGDRNRPDLSDQFPGRQPFKTDGDGHRFHIPLGNDKLQISPNRPMIPDRIGVDAILKEAAIVIAHGRHNRPESWLIDQQHPRSAKILRARWHCDLLPQPAVMIAGRRDPAAKPLAVRHRCSNFGLGDRRTKARAKFDIGGGRPNGRGTEQGQQRHQQKKQPRHRLRSLNPVGPT